MNNMAMNQLMGQQGYNCWPYSSQTYDPPPPLKKQIENRIAEIERTLLQVEAMNKELAALKAALEGMP